MIQSILLFFLLCFLHGYLLELAGARFTSQFERLIIRLGVGLLLIPIVAVFFDLLRIPLHYISFLVSGILIYLMALRKETQVVSHVTTDFKTELLIGFVVTLLTLIMLAIFLTGAFAYTYMEDGDSWNYTIVSKMIAENMSYRADFQYNHYSEPYTQGYQIILALLHQANDSIHWTVKFFNSLFAALSLPFFYCLARQVFKKRQDTAYISLLATVMLFVVPSWLTHHIYSMSLNLAVIPLFMYSLFRIEESKSWSLICGLILGALIINHFFTAFVSVLIYLFFIVLVFFYKGNKLLPYITPGLYALIPTLVFYIPSTLFRHRESIEEIAPGSHGGAELLIKWLFENFELLLIGVLLVLILIGVIYFIDRNRQEHVASPKRPLFGFCLLFTALFAILLIPEEPIVRVTGCCSRVYTLDDFLFPGVYNLMHNPIGWGWGYFLFVLVGFVTLLIQFFRGKQIGFRLYGLLAIFILTLLFVHGMRLSFGLSTFRMWTVMTIFSSLFAGFGFILIYRFLQNYHKSLPIVFTLVTTSTLFTSSFLIKYEINTMVWPDHELKLTESHIFHDNIRKSFQANTHMLNLCRDSGYLIAYDMLPPVMDSRITAPYWREHEPVLHENIYDLDLQQAELILQVLNIEYVIAGFSCAENEEDRSEIIGLIRQLQAASSFKQIYARQSDILFQYLPVTNKIKN